MKYINVYTFSIKKINKKKYIYIKIKKIYI